MSACFITCGTITWAARSWAFTLVPWGLNYLDLGVSLPYLPFFLYSSLLAASNCYIQCMCSAGSMFFFLCFYFDIFKCNELKKRTTILESKSFTRILFTFDVFCTRNSTYVILFFFSVLFHVSRKNKTNNKTVKSQTYQTWYIIFHYTIEIRWVFWLT